MKASPVIKRSRLPSGHPHHYHYYHHTETSSKSAKTSLVAIFSSAILLQSPIIVPPALAVDTPKQATLQTLSDCQLAVSIYPTFSYNASGGGGTATVTPSSSNNSDDLPLLLNITFDPTTLNIPAIQSSTTSILGLPLPPPLKIAIIPQTLKGTLNQQTGEAALEFLAEFRFSAGPLYTAPPLVVSTTLTTEHSEGLLRQGDGIRLGRNSSDNNKIKLVGVARVPRTSDAFLNSFLMLPTDALAVLSAQLILS
jgi:hypothetical protein